MKMGREGFRSIGLFPTRGKRLLVEFLKCAGIFFFSSTVTGVKQTNKHGHEFHLKQKFVDV